MDEQNEKKHAVDSSSGSEEVQSNRQLRKTKLKSYYMKPHNKKGANVSKGTPDSKLTDNKTSVVHVTTPVQENTCLPYCSSCGLPKDFCEFGSTWNICKQTALTEYSQYYEHYLKLHPEEKLSNLGNKTDTVKTELPTTQKNISKVKDQPKLVTIQRVSRAKHKVATIIIGLDLYDVKLDVTAKLLKRKFACGCSTVKGLPGQVNHIELQGDFENEITSVLLENFTQIPEDCIVHLSPK